MAFSYVVLEHGESVADATAQIQVEESNHLVFALRKLMTFLKGAIQGTRKMKVDVMTGALKASGTLTFASVIATDAVEVNGVSFACVASGATGDQFNIGGDDTESAANAAAAINASATALVVGVVDASSDGAVLTITAKRPGLLGNAITISSPDATITASGARLESGSDGTEKNHGYGSETAN